MKKLLYIIPVLLVSISPAIAQELTLNTSVTAVVSDSLKSSASQVQTSTDKLVNIKDSRPSEADEFAGRKKVVADALALAVNEVKDLQARFFYLPEFEKKSLELELTTKYTAELENYLDYYTTKIEELETLTTIDEIKALAKEISDFRDSIYNKSIDEIADFTLLFYTRDTINTASLRLSKIAIDIRKLERLNLLKPASFRADLSEAAELIKIADANYTKAELIILKSEEIKPEIPKLNLDKEALNGALQTPIKITARQYMENSLNEIKNVYGIFLQISKDVRKALGLTSR